jgi:hypothetical protein
MLWFVLSLLVGQAQTVPSNITKVPRDSGPAIPAPAVCSETQGTTELKAGQAHEAVFFVDATRYDHQMHIVPQRYQELRLWASPATGVHRTWVVAVNDSSTLACPSGTANAGQRPHIVMIPALTTGTYQIMGQVNDRRLPDGSLLPAALLVRIPQSTVPFTVVVK